MRKLRSLGIVKWEQTFDRQIVNRMLGKASLTRCCMAFGEVRVPISASKVVAYLVGGGLIWGTRAGNLDCSICTVNSSIAVTSALELEFK